MKQPPPITLIATLVVLALITFAIALFSLHQLRESRSDHFLPPPIPLNADPLEPNPNLSSLSIPEFTLTTQNNEPFTRDDLRGSITVIDFFFTYCPFICPTMKTNMKQAQDALADTGVRFVSFSVDPEHDTPDRLREHAASIGADTSTWTFLTADAVQTRRILREGLLLADLTLDPSNMISLPGGAEMPNITHPGRFILLDHEANILALYNGLDQNEVQALIERARAADQALNTN
ncbi:MAG: SCO family protein [Planctomycetota bacterium]|nr:SCO family protein [Planctomycetota bacterium]